MTSTSAKRDVPWDPVVSLSKNLSRILRHEAVNLKLAIGADGFVNLADMMALPDLARNNVQDVKNVVYSTDLKRFEIVVREGKEYIRACQGHTIAEVDAELIKKQFKANHGYNRRNNNAKNEKAANGDSAASEKDSAATPATSAAPAAPAASPAAPVAAKAATAAAPAPSTATVAAPATAATPAAPKPNAWNTKAPVFVPSSSVLANLPTPIVKSTEVAPAAPVAAAAAAPVAAAPAPPTPAAAPTPVAVVVVEKKAVPAPAAPVVEAPKVNENLGIEGPLTPIPSEAAMPVPGVWQRTTLYEPKGSLGPAFEQSLAVLWLQARSGIYIDLRVPAVAVPPPAAASAEEGAAPAAPLSPHDPRAVKSFAGQSSFDHASAHLDWARRVDYRAVPAKDTGLVRLTNGGQTLVEDGVLPGDDYREVWVKQVMARKRDAEPTAAAPEGETAPAAAAPVAAPAASAAPAAPKKLWSSLLAVAAEAPAAPAATTAKEGKAAATASAATPEASEVSAVLLHKRAAPAAAAAKDKKAAAAPAEAPAAEEVGYFVMMDGYFALTVNLRGVEPATGVRRPTVAELRNYFNPPAAAPAAPVAAPVAPTPAPVVEAPAAPAAAASTGKPAVFSYAAMTKKVTTPPPAAVAAPSAASSAAAAAKPLEAAQIEDYLSRYVTVVGNSNSWSILYSLHTELLGKSLSTAQLTLGGQTHRLLDILRRLTHRTVSGKMPKFLSSVVKDANAPASAAAAAASSGDASGKERGSRREGGDGRRDRGEGRGDRSRGEGGRERRERREGGEEGKGERRERGEKDSKPRERRPRDAAAAAEKK